LYSGDEGDAGKPGKKVQWRYGVLSGGLGGYACQLFPTGYLSFNQMPGAWLYQPPPLTCGESDVPTCESATPKRCEPEN